MCQDAGFLCGVVCGTTPINPQLVQSIKGIIGDFLPYIIAIGSSLNINLDNVYKVSQPTEKQAGLLCSFNIHQQCKKKLNGLDVFSSVLLKGAQA